MKVLVACETSGRVRDAFAARGHDAWSCDLLPSRKPGNHLQGDVSLVLDCGWDLMVAHPNCTFLCGSAAWAFADPDFKKYPVVGYHQQVLPGTLTGQARREARVKAVQFARFLYDCKIPRVVIENPRGHLSTAWRKPDQTIQPNRFGDNASKGTCLWLKGVPPLKQTLRIPGRLVEWPPDSGKMVERWANQTDSGQNKLTPGPLRWQARSDTYPGIADALADQYGQLSTLVLTELL